MSQNKKKSPSMWGYTQAISPANKAGRAALVKVGRTIFAMNPVGRALHAPFDVMWLHGVLKGDKRKAGSKKRKVQNRKNLERHRNATNSFLKRGG